MLPDERDQRAGVKRLPQVVAPFASVKSVSAHIELHTIGMCGLASGITMSSAWIGCATSPGSIAIAHTEDEHIPIAELHRAADLYVHIARELLTT